MIVISGEFLHPRSHISFDTLQTVPQNSLVRDVGHILEHTNSHAKLPPAMAAADCTVEQPRKMRVETTSRQSKVTQDLIRKILSTFASEVVVRTQTRTALMKTIILVGVASLYNSTLCSYRYVLSLELPQDISLVVHMLRHDGASK